MKKPCLAISNSKTVILVSEQPRDEEWAIQGVDVFGLSTSDASLSLHWYRQLSIPHCQRCIIRFGFIVFTTSGNGTQKILPNSGLLVNRLCI